MRKINKIWFAGLLTILGVTIFGINAYAKRVIINNVQQAGSFYSGRNRTVAVTLNQQRSCSQLTPKTVEGDVVIDSVIDVPDGSVYYLEATGTVTITATGVINATGKGYRGGAGGGGYPSQGQQGESSLGVGGYSWEANGAGGGGGHKGGSCCGSQGGGGGAHATDGTRGGGGDAETCHPCCCVEGGRIARYGRPGIAIADAEEEPHFGAGGGGGNGGSYWGTTGLKGGNGGGIIKIKAAKIIVRGRLEANGADGQDGPWAPGDTGGGGGGAGGAIWLEAAEVDTGGGTLAVAGGKGSRQPGWSTDHADGGDGGKGLIKTEIVAPSVDYIKVFPDPAYVCVNGELQFVVKGYGFGENGEKNGDPDPETYAPAGDDTGPEDIDVSWVTSVPIYVGTIDENSGLFQADEEGGDGNVRARYTRPSDQKKLIDIADITVIGVKITAEPDADFVMCRAPKPGKMPKKATQIILKAEGTPFSGKYAWAIVSGNDKIKLRKFRRKKPKVRIEGIKPSWPEKDVEVMVTYTLHDHPCSATYKLTVKRPASAPIDDVYYNAHPTQKRGLFCRRYVQHELLDQFDHVIEVKNIPIGENLKKIEGFSLFVRTGQGPTSDKGTFLDYLRSSKLSRGGSKWHQILRAGCRRRRRRAQGGWDVGHFHITFGGVVSEWEITKNPAP